MSDGSWDSASVREARERGDVEYLIAALSDTDTWVRGSAARSLGVLGHPAAVAPLIRLLRASDDGLRVNALRALRRIGDARAAPAVYEVAASSSTPLGVRFSAMLTLAGLGDRRAVGLLVSVLTEPNLDGQLAIPASATLPRTSVKVVKKKAARELVALGATEAIPALADALPRLSWRERLRVSSTIRRLRHM